MFFKIFKNSSNYSLIFLIIFLFFVLWWACPGITKGTSDIRMMNHFDLDEANIVSFYSQFYKNIFTCPHAQVSYPTGFYYLAGTYLFPYSLLNKNNDNYQVIAITFRALNVLLVCLTVILIYRLASYFLIPMFFKIALLLLLIFTPNFLVWGLNNRPHPFENVLLLLGFCFAFAWLKNRKMRNLLGCIFMAALAFGVKYSGIFMIPPLFIFLIDYFYRLDKTKFYQFPNKNFKLINFLSSSVIIMGLGIISFIYCYLIPYVVKSTRTGANLGIKGLTNAWLFKYGIFCLESVVFLGFLWLFLNIYSHLILKLQKKKENNSLAALNYFQHFILFANTGFLSMFSILTVFLMVFLLTNPHAIVHPLSFLKAAFGLGLVEFTFSSPNNLNILKQFLTWSRFLFHKSMLGVSSGIMLLWYLIFEILYLKRDWREDRVLVKQRIFIWIYILTNFMFLLIFIKFRVHHYLLMIAYLCLILISYRAYKTIIFANHRIVKILLVVLFSGLLCWNLIERAPLVLKVRDFKINRGIDTGLMIGKWLADRYDDNTKIWTDFFEFYVPLKFTNVYSMYSPDRIEDKFNTIEAIVPDILIITNAHDPALKNMQKVEQAIKEGRLKGFKLEKVFNYEGPLGQVGWYKRIFIYSKMKNK